MSGVAPSASSPANNGTDVASIFDTMSYGPAPEAKNVVEVSHCNMACAANAELSFRLAAWIGVARP